MYNNKKIRGWLIIFAVALPIQLVIHAYYLIRSILVYLSKDFTLINGNYGEAYSSMVNFSGVFLIISSLFIFVGIFIVNILFFLKKANFPKCFILINGVSLIFSFASEYLGASLSGISANYFVSIRLMIILLLATIYLTNSNQVKVTFGKLK
jgi:hypothetical protein